jgi:3-deoxy-D-manno-octulosonate 8-phosphate phosphatase (KDO 8-P phosphatase)
MVPRFWVRSGFLVPGTAVEPRTPNLEPRTSLELGTVNPEPDERHQDPVVEMRAAKIRLVLFDVDGVLTDGKILLHADGTESKVFDIKDGTGIVWAQRLGITVGLLSARSSAATTQRAAQLGVTLVHQGVASKRDAYDQITASLGLDDREIAYMGDDVLDLPVLGRVGLAAAPADAVDEVRSRVHWVAAARGGAGAARELIEVILRSQGRWESLIATYLADAQGQRP